MFAQIPGAEDAIEAAADHGWEAVLLVVIVLAACTALGIILRQMVARQSDQTQDAKAREERLAARVDKLEGVIETKLFGMVTQMTIALTSNTEALKATTNLLSDVKTCVRESHKDTVRLLSALEGSPCLMAKMGLLSDETKEAIEAQKDREGEPA